MNGRLSESHGRAIRAAVSVLAAITVIVALSAFSLPIVAGSAFLAIGVAYWAFRNEMPRPKDLIIVVAIAIAVTAGLAWWEGKRGDDRYDFIVVPRKGVIAVVSAFPGPHHEVLSGSFEYGEHVQVVCFTVGDDGQDWAEMGSGYFMPERELAPAPNAKDEPPRC